MPDGQRRQSLRSKSSHRSTLTLVWRAMSSSDTPRSRRTRRRVGPKVDGMAPDESQTLFQAASAHFRPFAAHLVAAGVRRSLRIRTVGYGSGGVTACALLRSADDGDAVSASTSW